MNAPNPSSSSESHLVGIGLENYIHPTQSKTFASLRKQELIDIQNPAESKILEFIARTPKAGTTPVSAKVRQQEMNMFKTWIRPGKPSNESYLPVATLHAFTLIVMRNWLTTKNLASRISSRRSG